MIRKITKAYVRHYRDNNQTTAYVEWLDHRGKCGRTEGQAEPFMGEQMRALMNRAVREGVRISREVWG